MKFRDRAEAGKKLCYPLSSYKSKGMVVLALPRGGVPVAAEIAKYLNSPINFIMVRKIGSPIEPEYGLGAISEANTTLLDKERIKQLHVDEKDIKEILKREKKELKRRVSFYRNNKKLTLKGKGVILVDDGLATGVSAIAAAIAAKKLGAGKIVFAAPVCAAQSINKLKNYVDEVVCLAKPKDLRAIANYYEIFDQVKDEEVIKVREQEYYKE